MERFRWTGSWIAITLLTVCFVIGFSFERSAATYRSRMRAEEPWHSIKGTWMFHAHYMSDCFIALAYFSIPVELMYFISKSQVFPFRYVFLLFSAFIVLCGITHLMNLWTVGDDSVHVHVLATVFKILCALVSCATAVVLVHVIPDLLSLKIREMFLKHKAEELDREVGLMRCQEENGRMARMLTTQIRTSLDKHTILTTTLRELANMLDLSNCCMFTPGMDGSVLEVTHSLVKPRILPKPLVMKDATIQRVLSSGPAVVISSSSSVGEAMSSCSGHGYEKGAIAAVRVPLLQVATVSKEAVCEQTKFALMVLALPSNSARSWHVHDLALLELVADQLAVALSHAAVLALYKSQAERLEVQRKALEEARNQVDTAQSLRDNLLEVIDNEMRVPMRAVISLLSILQESELPLEQQRTVRNIKISTLALHKLMDDFLDLSMLESKALLLTIRPFALYEVFHTACSALQPLIAEKRLDVDIRIDQSVPPHVLGDRQRVLQVVADILDNACKFNRREGKVILAVTRQGPVLPAGHLPGGVFHGSDVRFHNDQVVCLQQPPSVSWPGPLFYLRVVVWDDGNGVEPSVIPKLFQKFAQGDSTTRKKYGGAGLGLSICQGLCRLQGGDVMLHSDGVGTGCTVTAILQLGAVPSPVLPPLARLGSLTLKTENDDLQRRLQGTRVLVIDNNPTDIALSKSLLTSLGCWTHLSNSGKEGLAAIATNNHGVQVVLLELDMPDMDGYEVALRVYAAHVGSARPHVLVVTAHVKQDTRLRCRTLGIDGLLIKPLLREELGTALCSLLHL